MPCSFVVYNVSTHMPTSTKLDAIHVRLDVPILRQVNDMHWQECHGLAAVGIVLDERPDTINCPGGHSTGEGTGSLDGDNHCRR